MKWKVLKNRILCSRPFLALQVLRGRPLICFWPGEIHCSRPLEVDKNAKIVGCRFDFSEALRRRGRR